MAGLGQYAGSFAAGFGQGMDDWREEDKKLSKQHKDAVDAIHQFARNNPYATQKDLENYASKSGVPDWQNVLGKGGLERLAAELHRKRGREQDTIDRARVIEGREDNKYFTELRLQEHEIFIKEMDRRLGLQKFMEMPMSEDKIGDIADATAEFLSGRHPQLDFDEVRKLYDYKSRLQQRAQNRQDKATKAAAYIEDAIAKNPNKYSLDGEFDKLRKEVREIYGFGPEVPLVTNKRAEQLVAAAVKAEGSRKAENLLKIQDDLRTQLNGQALFWRPEDAMGDESPAWQAARAALVRLGITNPAEQNIHLNSFDPLGMKREAEAKLRLDNTQGVADLAKTHNTVEGLIKSMGWEGYHLSDETINWLDGQIKAKTQARNTNRATEITDSIEGGLPNLQNIYQNYMGGDTERLDEFLKKLNETYAGTWGKVDEEEVLVAIQRKLLPGAIAGIEKQKTALSASSGYTVDSKVLRSAASTDILGQGLNDFQAELIYSLIDQAAITDIKTVSQVAQYIRQNNILSDARKGQTHVNIRQESLKVIREMSKNSSISFVETDEAVAKRREWQKVMAIESLLYNPDDYIANLRKDVKGEKGDGNGDWFIAIKRDLTNLQRQKDWTMLNRVNAVSKLNATRAVLLGEIQNEEAMLEKFGGGIHHEYYKDMLELIEEAKKEMVDITKEIVKVEQGNKVDSANITEESDMPDSSFNVDAQLKNINDKLKALKLKLLSSGNTNYKRTEDVVIKYGMGEAMAQADDDKNFLNRLKVILSDYPPGIPLVQILSPAELEKLKQIMARNYEAIAEATESWVDSTP